MKVDEKVEPARVDAFDAEWYALTYPDCLATRLSPREHYEKVGRMLGRAPGPGKGRGTVSPTRRPKVSVLCITYNHARYIEATLRGFCQQKTSFDVEFIVADDCSTDGTQAIIKRYAAQDRRIVPVLNKKNLGVAGNFEAAVARITGEYVALCEGDDFWVDPTKLQRQADQLDADPNLSLVFHPVEVFNDRDGSFVALSPATKPDLTIWELTYGNFIQTNSVMYRWRFRDGLPEWFDTSILPLDWYLHLCHAEAGTIGYSPRVMAKYRQHDGGIWSSAAKDPMQLRRRYGLQQLRLFKAVSKVAGGLFSDHVAHTFDYLLKEIFLDAFICDNADLMCALAREHGPALARLKLISDEASSLAGSGHAEETMKAIAASTRISVVVLTYNHAQYIEQCLASILRQQGAFELEVIIGDDKSSDDTLERIRSVARGRAYVTVLPADTNLGMLANMRRCLDACTGEFIAFCEGDDYWLGDRKLSRQVALMRRDPSLAMSFNWVLLEQELDGQMKPHPQQAEQGEQIPTAVIAANPLTANFSCCMYRSDAVAKIPDVYFEEKGNADWMFNMFVVEHGGIGFLKEIHSVYRLHSKGQWTSLTESSKNDLFERARQRASQLIGPARGFDSYRVTCYIKREKLPPEEQFFVEFDYPRDGNPVLLESGRLCVSGWAVDGRGRPLTVRVGDGESAVVAKTDQIRPDVARHIGGITQGFHSPMCGFSARPRFDLAESEWPIYIQFGEQEYKVATLSAFLSPGGPN